jgi:hypothetical protein
MSACQLIKTLRSLVSYSALFQASQIASFGCFGGSADSALHSWLNKPSRSFTPWNAQPKAHSAPCVPLWLGPEGFLGCRMHPRKAPNGT